MHRPVLFALGVIVAVGLAPGTEARREPQAAGQRAGEPPQTPVPAPGGQRGRGRGAVQVMTLTTPAWPDAGDIPLKHSQPGGEVSPALAWTGVPEGVSSFVLIVHDLDAAAGGGIDDLLHWMVWNIPGKTTGLPEGIGHAPELADGMRQISVSGPYYRGPAAPATGPKHHYAFELYALDTMLDVPAVGASPAQTRAAVLAAMANHVRGKAVMVGLFKRPTQGAGVRAGPIR